MLLGRSGCAMGSLLSNVEEIGSIPAVVDAHITRLSEKRQGPDRLSTGGRSVMSGGVRVNGFSFFVFRFSRRRGVLVEISERTCRAAAKHCHTTGFKWRTANKEQRTT